MLQLFKLKSLKKTRETVLKSDNNNAKKQRGRSMVEMLGVLAIIGVLSIGGISGYTIAMRRYRANEIINLVNKYAMTVYSSCQSQALVNPGEDGKHADGAGVYNNGDNWYWYCQRVPFIDSGLGALPQGVKNIGSIYTHDYLEISAGSSTSVTIVVRSSGDAVIVPVLLEDKALCETVFNASASGVIGLGSISSDCSRAGGLDENLFATAVVVMYN